MNLHIETKNHEGQQQRHWTNYHGFFRMFSPKRHHGPTSPTKHAEPSSENNKVKTTFDFPGFVATLSGDKDEKEGNKNEVVSSYSVCTSKPKKTTTTTTGKSSSSTPVSTQMKMKPPSRGGKYGEDEVITKPIDMRRSQQRNLKMTCITKDRIIKQQQHDIVKIQGNVVRRWTKSTSKVPHDVGPNTIQEPQSVVYDSSNYRPGPATKSINNNNNTMMMITDSTKESSFSIMRSRPRRHTLSSTSPASSCILSLATENDFNDDDFDDDDDDDKTQEEFEILCRKLSMEQDTKEQATNRSSRNLLQKVCDGDADDDNEKTSKILEQMVFKTKPQRRHSGTSQSTHKEQEADEELHHRALYFASSHVLINLERQKRGIPRLRRDIVLDEYARNAAKEMASLSMGQKIHSNYHGNIILGHTIRSMHERLMRRNVKERDNVLNPKFTAFGVATCKGRDGLLYLCQLFF